MHLVKRDLSVFFITLIVYSSILQFGNVINFKIFEVSIVLSMLFYLFFCKITFSKLIFVLYIPLLISSVLSSFYSNDLIAQSTFLFYFFSILLCYGLGVILGDRGILNFLNSYIFINIIIHFLGFLNFSLYNFSGIFENSNMYGLFCSFSFIFIFLVHLYNDYNKKIYYYLFLFLNFFGIIFSTSRSSFVLMLFILIVGLIFKNKNLFKFIMVRLIPLIGLVYLVDYLGYLDSLWDKSKNLEGDYSNGRLDLWVSALDRIQVYGLGSNYSGGGLAVHNNYLNLALVFGYPVSLAFIFFWISILFFLIYMYFKTKNNNYIICILLCIFCLVYWFFEVGSAYFYVWMFFVYWGYTSHIINKLKNKADI